MAPHSAHCSLARPPVAESGNSSAIFRGDSWRGADRLPREGIGCSRVPHERPDLPQAQLENRLLKDRIDFFHDHPRVLRFHLGQVNFEQVLIRELSVVIAFIIVAREPNVDRLLCALLAGRVPSLRESTLSVVSQGLLIV